MFASPEEELLVMMGAAPIQLIKLFPIYACRQR